MVMNFLQYAAVILLFPGMLFTLVAAIWLSGFDGKITARMQRRVGPPILQPWYDFLKTYGKETIIPRKANKKVFLAAPMLGLVSCFVTAMFLPVGGWQIFDCGADTIVILYLLTLASVCVIIGAAASGSPFAGVGLSREMVSMISYELPFVLVLLAVGKTAAGAGVTFAMADITAWQALHGPMLLRWPLLPAAAAMLFVIPCEAGCHPFDIDEAETEICEGCYADYSGKPLARFKLMHFLKVYIMSGLFVSLFLHIETGILIVNILLYILMITIVTFIAVCIPHAVTARFKVEQVFKFYWTFVTGLAAVSLILVWCGL